MTFSPSDLPFGDAKSATGLEPFMAAAFAPAMMTSAMMMEGYAFWTSAARGMMPLFDEVTVPMVTMPVGIDVPETIVAIPQGIDVPFTTIDDEPLVAEPAAQEPVSLAEVSASGGAEQSTKRTSKGTR